MYFLIEIRSLLFFRQESTGPQGHPPRYHLKEYIINVLNIDIFPIFIFLSSSSFFSFFFFFLSFFLCLFFIFFEEKKKEEEEVPYPCRSTGIIERRVLRACLPLILKENEIVKQNEIMLNSWTVEYYNRIITRKKKVPFSKVNIFLQRWLPHELQRGVKPPRKSP